MSPQNTRVGAALYSVLPACASWLDHWRTMVARAKPSVVIVDASWDVVDQLIDGRWLNACDSSYAARYTSQLETAVTQIRKVAPQATVLWSTVRDINPGPGSYAACMNRQLTAYVQRQPHMKLLDLNAELCSAHGCRVRTPSGDAITSDGTHLSRAGRAFLAPWIAHNIAVSSR